MPSISEDTCENLKEVADFLLKEKNYKEAIEKYRKAIELDSKRASLFSNISQAYIHIRNFSAASITAEQAILLEPNNVRARYRLATAQMELRKFEKAHENMLIVASSLQNDIIRNKLLLCKKEMKFSKITTAMQKDPFSNIDEAIKNTKLPVDYDGPLMKESKIDIDFVSSMIEYLKEQKTLPIKYVCIILKTAKELFKKEDNIKRIDFDEKRILTICGDVHGQFFDVLKIFELNGYPSSTQAYLFNGDLVDRGPLSVEIILTLFAYKIIFPNSIFIARGNHEIESMNRIFGFEEEVVSKYNINILGLFRRSFHTFPISHIIYEKYFVVHGGIPKKGIFLDHINKINRFCDPSNGTLISGLLWSDPGKDVGTYPSPRNEGVLFGEDVTNDFLSNNNLECLIRSHVWKMEGYEYEHNGKCLTIFSAPNYTGIGNKGAYINVLKEGELVIKQFDYTEPSSNKYVPLMIPAVDL
eukprot:GHVP01021380.1.p1 GENE.GHVP01021380.1~~GHVP01021380.1.p1  ORF type:complete len:471 (+),score=81.10 GHVP01021380.1:9-1421(+)